MEDKAIAVFLALPALALTIVVVAMVPVFIDTPFPLNLLMLTSGVVYVAIPWFFVSLYARSGR